MRGSIFKRSVFPATFACAPLAGLLSVSAANYLVTDLGTLGGESSTATDLNTAGQVVGVARTMAGRDHAFRWQNGVMTDLGTLGGTTSHAAAINEAGAVVGWAETPEGGIRACLFGTETNVSLCTTYPNNTYAADINDQGQVVGWMETQAPGEANPKPIAALFRPSNPTPQFLSVGDGSAIRSRATAINNEVLIAGWTGDRFWFWGPHDRATIWRGLSGMAAATRFGGIDSYVRGMSAAGQIVGESGFDYVPQRATLWFGPSTLNLGSLALGSSTAAAINNRGQIIGSAEAYRFGLITNWFPGIVLPGADTNAPPPAPVVVEGYEPTRHAFLWQNGVMADLNDLIPTNSGWDLTEAASVNDAGQIVGTGQLQGQTRAFLLTPVSKPNQIPFIRVLSPSDGEWVSSSRISFQAEAYDPDGRIEKVEFFARRVTKRDPATLDFTMAVLQSFVVGATYPPGYLGTARNPWGSSYALDVTNLAAGNYLILAKATDDRGATACAPETLLRVKAPPVLQLVREQLSVPTPSPPDGTLSLVVEANEEMACDIETSTDLVNWTKLDLIQPTSWSARRVFNVSEASGPRRFYRAVAR